MPNVKTILRRSALAAGLGALPFAAAADAHMFATAELHGPEGEPRGAAEFDQLPAGVLIKVRLNGLTPGEHGIHIHETGACTPDFSAAGGHFAPEGGGHGFASEAGPHAGDLPNIFVDLDGGAVAHFLNPRISLAEGEGALFDADGAALIVHEHADTYGEDAGAGGRVACAVIEPGLR